MSKKKKKSTKKSPVKTNTDTSGIEDRIKGVSETGGNVSGVLYGRSGTGKTTTASSFPKPILFLDIKEEGTDSIKDLDDDECKVMEVETWDDIEQMYWYLEGGGHKFKTVVIDTVSQMQNLCLDAILEDEGKEFATQQIWGMVSGLMKTWTIDYRDLPMNVLFLAQERVHDVDQDEDDENKIEPSVGPQLMPSVASTLNAAVKVIGYTYIHEKVKRTSKGIKREPEYRLRVGPHPYYTTKIRKPKNKPCPEFISNPSFDQIDKIMKGKWEEAKSGGKKKSKKSKGGK